MSKLSELRQTLIEHGVDMYEGVSFDEIQELVKQGVITKLQAGLVSLTCPEWERFKQDLGVSDE
jgi:hypothetical protein